MSITGDDIFHRVSEFLKDLGLSEKSSVLVGFSGGPDSTTLLHLLKRLQPSLNYSLSAIYIDHGIRGSEIMEKECLRVIRIARKMDVALEMVHVPSGKIRKVSINENKSIEETARDFRYEIFQKKKKNNKYGYLALGHNLDDTLETLIMRFFQGSGIHGLKGIAALKGWIIRPLNTVSKEIIKEYVIKNNLEIVTDETNNQTVYLRNQIRHKLIPEINKIFPGYKKALLNVTRKMEMAEYYITEKSGDFGRFSNENGVIFLSPDDFFSLSPFEKMEILYTSWDKWIEKPKTQLPFGNIYRTLYQKQPGESDKVLGGFQFFLRKVKDKFFWKRLVVFAKKSYLSVITLGTYRMPSGLVIDITQGKQVIESGAWLYPDLVDNPLIVRSRNPGDFICLTEGRKSIKKLFGEWKVPGDDRWKIPIIEDRTGILLVLGEGFGYKNRVTVRHKKADMEVSVRKLVFKTYME